MDGDLQQEIERILLGGDRKYDRQQVAELAGLSVEEATGLWRALGFAAAGEHEVVWTDADVETLRRAGRLVEAGVVDADLVLATTRMLGRHLSRLAEWQVQLLSTVAARQPGAVDELVESVLPELEAIQTFVWRRHLAAYAGRALAGPGEELDASVQVVGFADMVGYTGLTRKADEAELTRVLDAFESAAVEIVGDHRGRIVKMLGDEVLFLADDPVAGAEIALALTAYATSRDDLPELRAGLAAGRVLSRFGDVYGSVVNIASRLTSIARPGTVLVDRELADALEPDPAYRIRPTRAVNVRGYPHLRPWSLKKVTPPARP